MPANDPTRTVDEPLDQVLYRQIERRTGGRIRCLGVVLGGNRVAVRGVSPSYHVKQLALVAVREMLPVTPVDLGIEVQDNPIRAPVGRDRPVARGR